MIFLLNTFPREWKKFEVDSYGVNKATYLGMEIEKASNSKFEGITPDPNNYEDRNNHNAISHERTRQPDEALTQDGQAIVRSELWKSMWVARIARRGAIYDESADAQTRPGWGGDPTRRVAK